MARTMAIKNYKNLNKGFITEGNEFDEVDGALRDGLNIEILRTGGTRRRRGIDKEGTATADKAIASSAALASATVYDWNKVGGDPDLNVVCIQIKNYIYIYKKGVTEYLLDNYLAASSITMYASYPGYPDYTPDIQMESINGALYVVGPHILPMIYTYSGGSFYGQSFPVYHRDFDGDPNDDQRIYPNSKLYATNYKITGRVGTFTPGENVTGGAGAAFVIANVGTGGGVEYAFIQSWTTLPIGGEFITGATSGATATVDVTASVTPMADLSVEMKQNLYNQGWIPQYDDESRINSWVQYATYWPMNDQVWFAGKNSSGVFTPSELEKIDFGTTFAPKGKCIIDTQYPASYDPYDGSATFATQQPSVIGTGFGRVFLGGMNTQRYSNWIFFSPILTKDPINSTIALGGVEPVQAGLCYQQNDPTAEYDSSLLATDGGTIIIAGMDKAVRIVDIEKAVVVLATNGVWIVTGTTSDTGFTADGYSVDRISKFGCKSPKSVVVVDKEVFFWNDAGIFSVAPSDIPGKFITTNITSDTIKTHFSNIGNDEKNACVGYYDAYNEQIRWAYKSGSTITEARHRDTELLLDLKLKCFFPPSVFATVDADKNNDPYILGYVQDSFLPGQTGFPTLKPVCFRDAAGTGYLFFAEYSNEDFKDWANWSSGAYYSSFGEIWPDHVGDPVREKKPLYVFAYFKKTEDGFVDNGSGGLIATHPSSCLMTAKYSWHITDTSGKWSGSKQVYRFNRPYIPVDVNDTYDTGESIIVTKTRFKGKGKALTIRFESEDGKDFQLLGISIPYTATYFP